ncbi:sulfurtransferase [Thiomicrospira sp. XS5]|nr:sulfurtransferase [Thiomicrospira sp. XS5]
MVIEKFMMLVVGTMVLLSSILAYAFTPAWLLLTGFIGINLLISGLTGFCPMVYILRKFGLKHGCAFRNC